MLYIKKKKVSTVCSSLSLAVTFEFVDSVLPLNDQTAQNWTWFGGAQQYCILMSNPAGA